MRSNNVEILQPGVTVGRTSVMGPTPNEVPDESNQRKADKDDRGIYT